MDISSFLIGVLGIAVSVITFIITYQQTIGARKERAKTAVHEINKVLYRNLILEEFLPSFEEIDRMLSAKIIEHKIKSSDLLISLEFVNLLYTRLVEDELIELRRKNKLIKKINEQVKVETGKTLFTESIKEKPDKDNLTELFTALISLSAGLIIFIIIFYKLRVSSFNASDIGVIFILLVGMTLALLFTQNLLSSKNRSSITISPERSRIQEMFNFENQVFKKLKSCGFDTIKKSYVTLINGGRKIYMDFYARKNNKEYLIEVKSFGKFVTPFILSRLNDVGLELKKVNKTASLVLITKDKLIFDGKTKANLDSWDYILDSTSLDELKKI